MELKSISIFEIDAENKRVAPVDKDRYGEEFDKYLKGLVNISKEGSGRLFKFERDTTEVRSLIPKIIANEEFDSIGKVAASRLLSCEEIVQKTILKLNKEIQKGILVQAVFQKDENYQYVICKADQLEFIKNEDYNLTKGLPTKKKVFKAFVTRFNSEDTIENVVVYDTNTVMAKYWWKNFLELEEVYTDKHNTATAFEALDKAIFVKLRKKAPRDYIYLRNSTVRYFRANTDFEMEDYLQNAIGNYMPFDNNVDIDDIKTKIRNLPNTRKFDNHFGIVKDQITAKFINKIPLSSQIDLVLKQDIENLDTVITAFEDKDGKKYVKIQSEKGYNFFSNNRKKEE